MINLGRVENLGLRKINTHIPNQFELSRREIQKDYWDNMQLDFMSCMYDTTSHPQPMIIPGKPELDHWTSLRVSSVQVKRKWLPKSSWRRLLDRLARRPFAGGRRSPACKSGGLHG